MEWQLPIPLESIGAGLTLLMIGVIFAGLPVAAVNPLPFGDAAPDRQSIEYEQPDCINSRPTALGNRTIPAVVERVGENEVKVTYDLTKLRDVSPTVFEPSLSGLNIEIVTLSGFTNATAGGKVLRWDTRTESTNHPSITYRQPPQGGVSDQGITVSNESYLLTTLPNTRYNVSYDVHPNGTTQLTPQLTQNYVYIGNYTTVTRSNGCHDIRLVIHPDANLEGHLSEYTSLLQWSDQHYPVGHRYERVSGFIVPTGLPGLNKGIADGPVFVAQTNLTFLSFEEVVTHEYVHTRQSGTTDSSMKWWTEASAMYYGYRLPYEQEMHTPAEYNQNVVEYYNKAPWYRLGNDENVKNRQAHYTWGSVTLARLDQRIRVATDGNRSLIDVAHRIERSEKRITRPRFKNIVANVSGQRMDVWIDAHIEDSKPVEPPLTDGQAGYPVWAWYYLPRFGNLYPWGPLGFLGLIILHVVTYLREGCQR